MAYEAEEIRTSQEIFYYLLEHHELREEDDQLLYKAYTEEESIRNLVKSQGEIAGSNVERYGNVIYLIPKEENNFLGFSKQQLKGTLCKSGATDKDYYLSQFVILTLLVEFFDGQGSSSKSREYMRVGELMNCLSARLKEGAAEETTAELFAKEGAKVIVVGTKEELGESCVNEIKAAGGEAIFCKTDVTSDESLDNLVKTALDAYGKIDILVNNAGVGGTTANMDQITMDEWNTVLATNLTAPFVLCKKLIPIMEKQGAGTIVNVASMAATAAGRGGLAYTSAKHGLLGLTRQMSLDHGRTGVRINAVLPGPIATDMIARVLAIPQHPVTMKIGMSPAKRPGEPIEVAQAIAFLASDEASFIHGAALAVDGGYTIF